MSKFIELHWQADLRAETELTRMGIGFEVKTIPLSKIDFKESQINGARIDAPLLQEVIEDYAAALEAGDVFPRIVVYLTPTGYLILWGNQRAAAVQLLIEQGKLPKKVELEAYVITDELDKMYREVVARSGNVGHGAKASREERLLHALHCVQGLGMSAKEAARAFNINLTTLNHNLRAEETRRNLQKAGIRGTERLGVAVLKALNTLDYDEDIQQSVATLAAKHGLTKDVVETAAKSFNAAKSHQQRLNRLKELEQSCAAQVKATVVERNGKHDRAIDRPRRREVLNLMDKLERFLNKGNNGDPFKTLEELQFFGEDDVNRGKELASKLQYRFRALGLLSGK